MEDERPIGNERDLGLVLEEIRRSRSGVDRLETRMKRLDRVIVDRPDEALGTVLLREELRTARVETAAKLSAMARDIDRGYDMMKFVVGGLIFSLIPVALTAYMQRARRRGHASNGNSSERE